MSEQSEQGEGPEAPKTVDDEWKRRAQEEKEKLERDAEAAAAEPPPPADFLTFVTTIAAQAFIHLGDAPHPITKETKVDLRQAKYTIDIVTMLLEKTKGNLTAEEDGFLDQLIYDLRMRYVKAATR